MVLSRGPLLHGRLSVHIISAQDLWLPDERTVREKVARAVFSPTSLNPYATVSLEHLPKPSKRIIKTRAIPTTDAPHWNHFQTVDVATDVSYLVIHVKSTAFRDHDRSSWHPRKSLGFVRIKAEHVRLGVEGFFSLTGLHGIDAGRSKNRGKIQIKINFYPIGSIRLLGQPCVPGTYFQASEACHVQFFQDAHCPDDFVLNIPGSSDHFYHQQSQAMIDDINEANQSSNINNNLDHQNQHSSPSPPISPKPPINLKQKTPKRRIRVTNYFEEIYRTIYFARKLVYICGWSIDTTLRLLRRTPQNLSTGESSSHTDESTKSSSARTSISQTESKNSPPPSDENSIKSEYDIPDMPLGELLKYKASQGVPVLMLVWDEVLSTSNPILRLKGFMNTKDEITRVFFRGSKVLAAVVPRLGGVTETVVRAPLVPCLFTFHEKLVISDIPAHSSSNPNDRELVTFCGGLDLTYGRWDTPRHSPFRTLHTEHATDFHNACFDVHKPEGPREPWHDVGAMITGPVVQKFVQCFEERWKRQGLGITRLVDINSDPTICDGTFQHETEKWTVQVFRSIDERSAVFAPVTAKKLESKKGRRIDRSIHHAYVHCVRAAHSCKFSFLFEKLFVLNNALVY